VPPSVVPSPLAASISDTLSCALTLRFQKPVFEAEFADAAAMTAARESPQGRQVSADVADYATGGVVVLHCAVQNGTC